MLEDNNTAQSTPEVLGILFLYNKKSQQKNEFSDMIGFTSDDKSFLPVLSNQVNNKKDLFITFKFF